MEQLLAMLGIGAPALLLGFLKWLDWHTARSKSWNEV